MCLFSYPAEQSKGQSMRTRKGRTEEKAGVLLSEVSFLSSFSCCLVASPRPEGLKEKTGFGRRMGGDGGFL